MHLFSILRLLGLLLMLFSITLLPTVVLSWLYHDGQTQVFLIAALSWLLLGCAMWLPVHKHKDELRVRDGFLIVVLFWLVLGFAGAVPLTLTDNPELSVTDAVFESFSGLTTTGATVISGLIFITGFRFSRSLLLRFVIPNARMIFRFLPSIS